MKTYNISDTANNKLNDAALDAQLRDDVVVGPIFDGINREQGTGTFDVVLVAPMTSIIEDAIDAVIAAHDGEPLSNIQVVQVDDSKPLAQYAIADGSSLRARLIGTHNAEVTAGATENLDWSVTDISYQGANKQVVMNGLEILVDGAAFGDSASFQVVHPVLGVLDEFGTDWYVDPQRPSKVVLYKANLFTGLIIRIKYKSTGGSNVRVLANLYRHIDTSIDV